MTQQSDKSRQYGQTAATLLVAYLFVLQGIALGLSIGARAGQGALGGAVCLTARASVDNRSQAPRPASHGMDACCLQHCSGLDGGVVAAGPAYQAPAAQYASLLSPPRETILLPRREVLPLGARAPPSRVA
ncbi:hypothetical protein A8B73_02050 [Methylosinus sp. 3S-1]|nr:hypothetical protein A8B73_02050 [Methylosinus sp. 3S-1]